MALPYQWQMRVERLKKMFGGMFGRGERRPQLCPACGALGGYQRDAMPCVWHEFAIRAGGMEQRVERIFWRTRAGDDRDFDLERDCF